MTDYGDLSDEEFLNSAPPPPASFVAGLKGDLPEPSEEREISENAEDDDDAAEGGASGAADAEPELVDADAPEELDADGDHTEAHQPEAHQDGADGDGDPEDEQAGTVDTSAGDTESSVDLKAVYDKLMAPIQVGDQQFVPSSPEEIIQLAQIGANLQKQRLEMAPKMRHVAALEKAGLLDDTKINFLIDIAKGNKKAIERFLADSKIDPLELDTSETADYQPTNFHMSAEEQRFEEIQSSVLSRPQGVTAIQKIRDTWDRASIQEIYKTPELLEVIYGQMQNGIYEKVTSEVARQRTLGNLQNMPIIQAYKTVGDVMHANGAFADVLAPQPGAQLKRQIQARQQQQPRVLGSRVATPKPTVPNSSAAKAASASRSSAPAAKREVDLAALSDDDFMKLAPPGSH